VIGRRHRRPTSWVVAALVAAATLSGCRSPVESAEGLLVASGGSLLRLDAAGVLQPVAAAPGGLRHVAAAGRSVVAVTEDGQVLAATAGGPSANGLAWRALDVTTPDGGFTAGIDVSPDGASLAVVRAHEEPDRLELVVVDLRTGDSSTRSLDLGANGPPSWLTNDEVALEVVGTDGAAKVVAVGVGGDGDGTTPPDESRSRGFALAAAPDGLTIAVADDAASGVVVRDRRSWWAGDPGNHGVDPPPADDAVQDVAIDADGSRVAVVYATGDPSAWTLAVYRLAGGHRDTVVTTTLESSAPPTIDWLE
jgi:hypothetical protein